MVNQYYEFLINDLKINKKFVIFIKFDDKKNEKLKDADKLYAYLKSAITNKNQNYYVLFDEIQDVKDFEPVILDLYEKQNIDIYLTGSNSYMLSGQIATKFTGRSTETHVLPFCFSEFVEFKQINSQAITMNEYTLNDLFNEYRKFGGFPLVASIDNTEEKMRWLANVNKQSLDKDILPYFQIRDKNKFKLVTNYLYENIANITSSNTISSDLHKDDRDTKIDHKTIDEYIHCLCKAFLLYKTNRYDIKGREHLKSKSKYYSVDVGLRNCVIGNTLNINKSKTLENIIFIELIKRGYNIYVGYVNRLEIDFVATKDNDKIYIQVCESIKQQTTFEREIAPLLQIKDSYQKILIINEKHDLDNYQGIKIINCVDWLLNK